VSAFETAQDQLPEEYIVCPVKNCRRHATEELTKRGVFMFLSCTKHAMEIEADGWHGWAIDYSVTGGVLQVMKKF
jgi:hypothetical protein